jgi:hypothetical protein
MGNWQFPVPQCHPTKCLSSTKGEKVITWVVTPLQSRDQSDQRRTSTTWWNVLRRASITPVIFLLRCPDLIVRTHQTNSNRDTPAKSSSVKVGKIKKSCRTVLKWRETKEMGQLDATLDSDLDKGHYQNTFNFFVLFLFLVVLGNWTQGLALVQQGHYHLSHIPSPFLL